MFSGFSFPFLQFLAAQDSLRGTKASCKRNRILGVNHLEFVFIFEAGSGISDIETFVYLEFLHVRQHYRKNDELIKYFHVSELSKNCSQKISIARTKVRVWFDCRRSLLEVGVNFVKLWRKNETDMHVVFCWRTNLRINALLHCRWCLQLKGYVPIPERIRLYSFQIQDSARLSIDVVRALFDQISAKLIRKAIEKWICSFSITFSPHFKAFTSSRTSASECWGVSMRQMISFTIISNLFAQMKNLSIISHVSLWAIDVNSATDVFLK